MILAKISRMARDQSEKIAAVQDGRAYSYGHFARWIGAASGTISTHALPAGGIAVIFADRLIEAWVLALALRNLGFTTIAVRDAAQIAELGLPGTAFAVAMGLERAALPPGFGASTLPLVMVPDELEFSSTKSAMPELGKGNSPPGGHIMMTSGTTGRSKKVLRNAATEDLLIPLHARINSIEESSVVYASSFAQWTAGGYRWPLITWSMGGTVVFHQGQDLHRPLFDYEMTHLFATPLMLSGLLQKPVDQLRRNDGTRLMVTGGALSKAAAAAVRQRLSCRLYSVLASTEALTVAVTPVECDEDLHWHRIHPERDVQVVDDAGHQLPAGQAGQVRIRILDGLTGYLQDEEATRTFFRGGWFYPGDLGVFREDGRLSLEGRASDVVTVLGVKVATGPIEQALQDRLGAEAVCIVAIRPEHEDEEIHVVIHSRRDLSGTNLRALIASELRPLGHVGVYVDLVRAFPRNDMGKIERPALRRRLLARRARRIARSQVPPRN